MQIHPFQANASHGAYHPGLNVDPADALVQPDAASPIAVHHEEAAFLEQFRPMPLSWLIAWLFRQRVEPPKAAPEPEPFEEHINGLA